MANSYYNQADKVVYDGNLAKAADLNTVNLDVETAFDLVEADITALDGLSEYWAGISEDWATTAEDTEVETGKYSSLHHAAKASASASAASTSASNASTSEGNASDSEAAAALSESNAATSASNASDSASAASTSEGNASTSASNAADSAAAALVSEGNASDSEAAAALSESNAAASETAAGLSEAAAALSESNAATSESNASDSETAAALSESNASDSETAAALSETNAGTSETNAAASEALAEKWAEEVEDTEVETGKYSALHWAAKAEDFATSINPALLVSQTGSTGAAEIPTGTTAQRPTAATGQLRYNTTEGSFEGYDGSEWGAIGGGGGLEWLTEFSGSELVTNGGFATDTDWTKGTGWTIDAVTDFTADCDGTQTADSDLSQASVMTVGETYVITYTVSGYSAGNVCAVAGAAEGTDRSADGTYTEIITCTTSGTLAIRADLDFVGSVDDVSATLVSTLEAGQGLPVNSASLNLGVEFPASPTHGDQVGVVDTGNNAGTLNIHCSGNGEDIMGSSDDFIIDLDRGSVVFTYLTDEWVLTESMSVAV